MVTRVPLVRPVVKAPRDRRDWIPGPSGSSTVPVESAEKINVSILSVDVPAGGGAPTVELRLSNDLGFGLSGLPASVMSFTLAQLSPGQNGGSSEWQSYVTRGPQATTESAERWTVRGQRRWYLYLHVCAGSDRLRRRAGFQRDQDTSTWRRNSHQPDILPENIPANNAPYDFVPTGGAIDSDDHRLIVNNDACNACHDNLELHGEARFDVEYCVTCHNPYSIDPDTAAEPWGGSVDMKVMIHKIHYGVELTNGYSVVGYGGTLHDYSQHRLPAGRQQLHDLPPGVQRSRPAGQ